MSSTDDDKRTTEHAFWIASRSLALQSGGTVEIGRAVLADLLAVVRTWEAGTLEQERQLRAQHIVRLELAPQLVTVYHASGLWTAGLTLSEACANLAGVLDRIEATR